MLFIGGKHAGNEQMDRRFMFMKKKKKPSGGLSAKFIDIYPRSQLSVYRTISPLVSVYRL